MRKRLKPQRVTWRTQTRLLGDDAAGKIPTETAAYRYLERLRWKHGPDDDDTDADLDDEA